MRAFCVPVWDRHQRVHAGRSRVGLNVAPEPNQGNPSRLVKAATGFDPLRRFAARFYLGPVLGITATVGFTCPRGSSIRISVTTVLSKDIFLYQQVKDLNV